MAKRVVEDEVEAMGPLLGRQATQPRLSVARVAVASGPNLPRTKSMPSYHPTRSALVNRALDVTDTLTGGKAGWVQRLVSYLFIGGFAAVVNLLVLTLMYKVVPLPFNDRVEWQHGLHWLLAFTVAAECSILANFIPNDYFTFRHLPGHQRSWLARASRFHVTCIAGTLLTLAISASVHFVGVDATVSQAIAIIIVTAFNFTAHHLFTYRHKPQSAPEVR